MGLKTKRGTSKYDYDLVIVGGGSAGIVSGVMAGALGLRTLVVEKYAFGGECLNTGCVPSKALIEAAKLVHRMKTANKFGLPQKVVTRQEAGRVLGHVRTTISRVADADASEKLLNDNGVMVRRGSIQFCGPNSAEIDGNALTSQSFIIATGSSPVVPEIPGLDPSRILTNQNLFELAEIPEKLLVIGGGPIGIEMAQAMSRLGSEVTLVQSGPRILPRDDSELTEILTQRLRDEGVDVRLNTTLVGVNNDSGTDLAILGGPEGGLVPFTHVLAAVGRRPNVNDLNLSDLGVEFNDKGMVVDGNFRTSVDSIYAVGDVTGEHQFSHLAEYTAKIAVRNIAFPGNSEPDFTAEPWATFTDPELAHVGMTEDDAKVSGVRYQILRQPFSQNDRAITGCETEGLVKLIVSKPLGKILGVQILGAHAAELAHEWILAMSAGLSVRSVADMIHIYPTLSMANQHSAQRWYESFASGKVVNRGLKVYMKGVRPFWKQISVGAMILAVFGTASVAYKVFNRFEDGADNE